MTAERDEPDSPDLSAILGSAPKWAKGGGLGVAAIATLVFLAWAGQVSFERSVQAAYQIEPAVARSAFAPAGGALATVYVTAGDEVAEGDALAEIETADGLAPLRAPAGGIVARAPAGPPGRPVTPGEIMAAIAPASAAAVAVLTLAPGDARRIRTGDAVSFVDAPDLTARIASVDPAPTATSRGAAAIARARLSPPVAFAGAGRAEIVIGRASLFSMVFGGPGAR